MVNITPVFLGEYLYSFYTNGNRKEYKRFPSEDSIRNSLTKTGKKKHWTTFYESGAQPVPSNALQDAVGHGHHKLHN